MKATNVVPLRPPVQTQYERYPLPFFDRAKLCTWSVKPTGNYGADCATGRAYAIEFLRSCDGSAGWTSLLQQIVADMIRAGTSGAFAGHPKVNGIVIGFMGQIGRTVTFAMAPSTVESSQ
jgi:hypothetical protein